MQNIKNKLYRNISFLLVIILLSLNLISCEKQSINIEKDNSIPIIDTEKIVEEINKQIKEENENSTEISVNHKEYKEQDIDSFVFDKLYEKYSLLYDTFKATITLEDGTVVHGIGYSDFSCFFEGENGDKSFFPAGFIIANGENPISENEIDKKLEVKNIEYDDKNYGFVLAYSTDSFYEHCVIGDKYIKYGIDSNGVIVYSESDYSKEIVDLNLGSLYSYDDDRYLVNTNVGEYVGLSGESLFKSIDYDDIKQQLDEMLANQDVNFASVDIETTAYYAQGAVVNYLLSMQEETFMGCSVDDLVKEVSQLDPMECYRITPDGNIIIEISKDMLQTPSTVAKWTVGMCCGIAVISSVALEKFVPVTKPICGAISGVAIDVFMQVVIDNHVFKDINWTKVAISAASGAVMAWVCPLAAASTTEIIAKRTGKEALSRLAGEGVLTFSNSVVSGVTNAAFAKLDGEEDVLDSYLTGMLVGVCCSAAASALSEISSQMMQVVNSVRPNSWLMKLSDKATVFIGEHQVRLKSQKIEDILNPKSIYEASKAGISQYRLDIEFNKKPIGGKYYNLKKDADGNIVEIHHMPADSTTGLPTSEGPAIKMEKLDHKQTASWGMSKPAQEYRQQQADFISQGKYKEAIQMDIDDIHSKFGDKYDDAIAEYIEYVKTLGWW